MRWNRLAYGLVWLLTAVSCAEKDAPAPQGTESVPVDLAFALQSKSSTRASVTTLLELANQNYFRGMERIRLIAFGNRGPVGPEDQAIGYSRTLPGISSSWDDAAYSGYAYHQGLVRNNLAHLYPSDYASLPEGTASVLV